MPNEKEGDKYTHTPNVDYNNYALFNLEPLPHKTMACLVQLKDQGRVTVPHEVRKYLELDEGDLVQMKIMKVSGGKKE